ncbi:MAG: lysoplasmalogenase [Chitinophagaceae bacterium]
MKKSAWLISFFIILATNLVALQLQIETLRMVSKPLLMPALTGYFLLSTNFFHHPIKGWIIPALFFCWLGDVLLLFESRGSVWFLLGLSAFLLAHIFYIIFFHNIRRREYIRGNALLLLLAVVYYAIMMDILSPHLGNMKLPVRIYGVVISFMLMLAMHTLLGKYKRAGTWMMIGAICFVISDTLLAFNKFYEAFQFAGLAVMFSYGLAQFFIVKGAIDYLAATDKKEEQ